MSWIKAVLDKARIQTQPRRIQNQFISLIIILLASYMTYTYFFDRLPNNKAAAITCIILFLFLVYIFERHYLIYPILFLWFLIGIILGEILFYFLSIILFFLVFCPIAFWQRSIQKVDTNSPEWHQIKIENDLEKLY